MATASPSQKSVYTGSRAMYIVGTLSVFLGIEPVMSPKQSVRGRMESDTDRFPCLYMVIWGECYRSITKKSILNLFISTGQFILKDFFQT